MVTNDGEEVESQWGEFAAKRASRGLPRGELGLPPGESRALVPPCLVGLAELRLVERVALEELEVLGEVRLYLG